MANQEGGTNDTLPLTIAFLGGEIAPHEYVSERAKLMGPNPTFLIQVVLPVIDGLYRIVRDWFANLRAKVRHH